MPKCDICSAVADPQTAEWRMITHAQLKASPALITRAFRVRLDKDQELVGTAEQFTKARQEWLRQIEEKFGASDWLLCPTCSAVEAGSTPEGSTLPRPSRVCIFGRGFRPAEADMKLAVTGLVAQGKGKLTTGHLDGIGIEMQAEPAADRFTFGQSINQRVRQEHADGHVIDCLVFDQRTDRDLAIVAIWEGEAAKTARRELGEKSLPSWLIKYLESTIKAWSMAGSLLGSKTEGPKTKEELLEQLLFIHRPGSTAKSKSEDLYLAFTLANPGLAILALVQANKSGDALTKYTAHEALRCIGPPEAEAVTPLLVTLKKNTDAETAATITRCLVRIGPVPDADVATLIEVLADEYEGSKTLEAEDREEVRLWVVRCLAATGAAAGIAVRHLVEILENAEPTPKAGGWFGKKKVEENEFVIEVIRALGQIATGAKRVVPVLTEALEDEGPRRRAQAAEALGKFGAAAKSALEALDELAEEDEDEAVQKAAKQAAKAIRQAPAKPAAPAEKPKAPQPPTKGPPAKTTAAAEKPKPAPPARPAWHQHFNQDTKLAQDLIGRFRLREEVWARVHERDPEAVPDGPDSLEQIAQCCLRDMARGALAATQDKAQQEAGKKLLNDARNLLGAIRTAETEKAVRFLEEVRQSQDPVYAGCAKTLLACVAAAEAAAKPAPAISVPQPDRIRFNCPNCAKAVNAPLAAAGKSTRCPACKAPVTVPAANK